MQHPPSVMVTVFRALSDQVYGSPDKHLQVRKQVCDWIEQHKERYEGFVEDVGGRGSAGDLAESETKAKVWRPI
jgi:hypothetical protein